jgi:aminomethyltransferase
MKRSPFFPEFAAHNPELVGIQGWEVANAFSGPASEHRAVRERVGLFDWGTTGEIEVQGRDATELVQKVIVNDAARLPVHRVLYTSILDKDGSMISDITVYRLGADHYLLMTAWGSNAAGERPEYDLLRAEGKGLNVAVTDVSSGSGLVALQGPRSRDLLTALCDSGLARLGYMEAMPAQVAGIRALISRTGYTGELGYEVLVPAEHAHDFWQALVAAGEGVGLAPCGMSAVFSLRLEKGYVMRFDFAGGRTPYEVGLGWTVRLDKGDFRGCEALLRRRAAGLSEKLVSLAIGDGYVPASGDAILQGEAPAGAVTSAAFGYTVGQPLALGYVPVALAELGTVLTVQGQDGRLHPASVGPRSPYDPDGKRLRA